MKAAILVLVCALLPLHSQAAEVEFYSSDALKDYPFSESVRVDDLLFLSGQIGTLPGTAGLIDGGIREQTRQTLENIQAALQRRGLSMTNVVKCTVMLADIADWPMVNEVYRTFFSPPFPARSAFAGSGLALGALVEIECIAAFAD